MNLQEHQLRQIIRRQLASLVENPDYIKDEHGYSYTSYGAENTVAFAYYNNILYTTDDGIHMSLIYKIEAQTGKQVDVFSSEKPAHILARELLKYAGRLWKTEKFISFWSYPKNMHELKKIVTDLENKLHIKIWNDGYKIDIIDEKTKKPMQIPLESYVGSEKVSSADLAAAHLASPVKKGTKTVPAGLGSKKMHAGKTQSQYDASRGIAEVKMIKLKELFNTPAPKINTISTYPDSQIKKYVFHVADKNGKDTKYIIMITNSSLGIELEVESYDSVLYDYNILSFVFATFDDKDTYSYDKIGTAYAFKVFSMMWKILINKLKECNATGFKFESEKSDIARVQLYKKFAELIDAKTDWKLLDIPTHLLRPSFESHFFIKSNIKDKVQKEIYNIKINNLTL